MGLADELRTLHDLREKGALSEAEFAQAKANLITSPPAASESMSINTTDRSLGNAANRWVDYQIVAGIVGLFVFLFFFLIIWLPGWMKMEKEHERFEREWNKSNQQSEMPFHPMLK